MLLPVDNLPKHIEQIPAAIEAAYRQRGLDTKPVSAALASFWSKGGALTSPLRELITNHALDWGEPLGYESWLSSLSQMLRGVVDITQRAQYHERLIALLAPLMPLPELLRLRDLREESWQQRQLSSWDQWDALLEAKQNPYTRDLDQRQDPAFPELETLKAEHLQDEIQRFIETRLEDYPGQEESLRAFLAFREVRETMDAYDLHRWLRWLSVFAVEQWVNRGLFNRCRWWQAFFSFNPTPIGYIRDAISYEAQSIVSHYPRRVAGILANDAEALEAFIEAASDETVKQLVALRDSPLTGEENWLRLARLTLTRGILASDPRPLPPGQSVYAALKPMFSQIEDPKLAARVGRMMSSPGLASREIQNIVMHCLNACIQQSKNLVSSEWTGLIRHLDDPGVMLELLEQDNYPLRHALLGRYKEQKAGAEADGWQEVYKFAARFPDAICHISPSHIDIPLWRIVWQNGEHNSRTWVVRTLCNHLSKLRECDPQAERLLDVFQELAETDAQLLRDHINERYIDGWSRFCPTAVALLWERHLPAFDPILLALLTHCGRQQDETGLALARQIIAAKPEYLLNVKPANLADLLPCLTEPLLEQVSPVLLKIIDKSAAQSLRSALAELIAQFDPVLLTRLGWLDKKTKNIRLACVDILIQHPQPEALKPLRILCQAKGLDQTTKDRILSHLEAKGENLDGLDDLTELSLQELAAKAGKLKRVSKTVERVYNPELAQLLPTLEPALVCWLLQQVATDKEEVLPRSVRTVLNHCPLEDRARFVEALAQQWLAHDGDPKLRWVLRLIPHGGDDRLVAPLVDAVKAWYRKRKPRAVHAIQALGQIDTVFALSQVKVISETRQYTDMLVVAAAEVLREAAQRRNQPLSDLFDELVPDFGLGGDGLVLDVGPYHYRITLQGDLSLRVVGPKDKITKTLPKAKREESPSKWAEAEATFKRLRKDIKTVAQQQTQRMQAALLGGRCWPAARWRKLFVDHLLFRSLAQSLIWSSRAPDGASLGTFRLAEDLSLIDFEDNAVTLTDDAAISLWHPVESDQDVIEGWRQHIEDYAITPLLEQVTLPIIKLEPEWQKDATIIACQGHVVSQGKFKSSLAKWGYRTGPVEDGGHIYEHNLPLAEVHLGVCLHHTRMPAWMDLTHEIALDNMTIYALGEEGRKRYGVDRYQGIDPKTLPAATVSMLLAQLHALAKQGSGYRENWEKI